MTKSKGNGVSPSNIQKHQVCLRHLRNFASKEYGWKDFPFDRINRSFVDGFVDYLRTEADCAHNTSMKHLAIFKKVYRLALDNQWVKHNAFAGYKMRLKIVDRAYLSEEEIDRIREKVLSIKRLDLIKDLFVFACFTGLAYIDLKNLKRKNIEENLGISWIKIKREKTGVEATIPLLPPARKIIEKWNPLWRSQDSETVLFLVPSNQKTNAYLKEIADLCSITKPLSFHIGRHSFATSIALCNNIPMETVSKMLGHSRISMTQQQIAELVNMHRSNYSKVESGERDLSIDAANKVAKYFGMSMDELVNFDGKLPDEVTVQDKTLMEQVKLIAELEPEEKSMVFKMIDTFLTKKKFKDFFQKNVAAL